MKGVEKGYVYIFSNSELPTNRIKIGKSLKNPHIRADQLSRQTGSLGIYKVEWSKEVPDYGIAEKILHYVFRDYHYEKEFFEIEISFAKKHAEEFLNNFFNLEKSLNSKGKRIQEAKKKAIERIKELEILDSLNDKK